MSPQLFIQLGDIFVRAGSIVYVDFSDIAKATLTLSALDKPSVGTFPIANEEMYFEAETLEYKMLKMWLQTNPSFLYTAYHYLNMEHIIYADMSDGDSVMLVIGTIDPKKYEGGFLANREVAIAAGTPECQKLSAWLIERTLVVAPKQNLIVEAKQ